MPNTLSITFHGMCFLARRGDKRTDVLCHPEDGAHTPALVVPVKYVEVGANQWQPDFVGHDSAGEEIGIWNLTGESLDLGVGTEDRDWQGLSRGFRMRDFHPDARTVDEAAARRVLFNGGAKGALISLAGGVFRFSAPPSIRVRVRKGGVEGQPADYASAVTWDGQLDNTLGSVIKLPTNAKGQALKLRKQPKVPIHVTNVARIAAPAGLEHFSRYYDFVENVAEGERISLLAARLDVDVYDCIPPTDD